jgi:twitching motility protein
MESMDENLLALYDSKLIGLDSLLDHAIDQDYLMKKRGKAKEGYGLWG